MERQAETKYGVLYSMDAGEARDVCRLGKGEECCAFLVAGRDGFECGRGHESIYNTIQGRIARGQMTALGVGLWAGCAWEANDACSGT